ncbi:alanine racemase [Virgibacillus natechei]|uniref:Alanine racemase n=1 Tax=Virgibacillus natechei TaxID=1216297 RepID=A0ABS4IKN4_9BACI|nr:alanine racemase [Virgibacillus natechei]MBP1971460.1 alanine racemase [Virgibacillus natechei]UZD13828.1 alanine racemase [Virgibacillus natechei]
MSETIYRDTWVEVDLDAIEYNIKQMKEKLPADSNIIAVVKADGYGHGSVQVAKKALQAGAKALAVALLEEALLLREASIDVPILVLGRVPPRGALIASEHDITLTFFQKEWLQEVNTYSFTKNLKLHMKWDTGMGRIGIRTEDELKGTLNALNENPNIYLTGVYTHFATADEKDLTYFYEQKDRFNKFWNVFKELWPHEVDIHIGNSAASIRLPNEMKDYIRFGISMYGLYPSNSVKEEKEIDLKQAFSLHSRFIHVKKLAPGESVSYGGTYTAEEEEYIGTIPIGYGDGWIRKLQGISVLVEGKRMPIIGRICMDQTMIRLDREYPVGTHVTLIGEQDNEVIEMDEIANYLDTINYEIPCIINHRVPRIYKEHNAYRSK